MTLKSEEYVREHLKKKGHILVKLTSQGDCMEPVLKSGDTILIEYVEASDIRIGDILAFSDLRTKKIVIHRVSEIIVKEDSSREFLMKPDRLYFPDGFIPQSFIIGRVLLPPEELRERNIYILVPSEAPDLDAFARLCSLVGCSLRVFGPQSLMQFSRNQIKDLCSGAEFFDDLYEASQNLFLIYFQIVSPQLKASHFELLGESDRMVGYSKGATLKAIKELVGETHNDVGLVFTRLHFPFGMFRICEGWIGEDDVEIASHVMELLM